MDNKQWFLEFDRHLMDDNTPSAYFDALMDSRVFPPRQPFDMLSVLKDVPQSPTHHPEGNVWNHTMQVVDIAAGMREESSDARVFMWAALLHDIGKAKTTRMRRGRYTAYDHDKVGAKMARVFLSACGCDDAFIAAVVALVRWHMQVLFVAKDMPFADISGMLRDVAPDEVARLALCDRMGRGRLPDGKVAAEKAYIAAFIRRCEAYMAHR